MFSSFPALGIIHFYQSRSRSNNRIGQYFFEDSTVLIYPGHSPLYLTVNEVLKGTGIEQTGK